MTNVYIDSSGKMYCAATPTNASDQMLVNPRPELIASLTADGATSDAAPVDQEMASGQTDSAVIADGSASNSAGAGNQGI